MTDVVIVGAGISGVATAYALIQAGLSVTVIDRYGPAAMASGWTLAGVRQSGRHPAELPLAQAAVEIWQNLAEELDGETVYRREGNLRLARTEAEIPIIEQLVTEQSQAGLDVRLVRGSEIQAISPAISRDVLVASFCPTDGHANPQATVGSYVDALRRKGADLRFGEKVLRVTTQGRKVTGVLTDKSKIACSSVVVASGVFGNDLLNPLGLNVPLDVHMVTMLRSTTVKRVLGPVIGVANADTAGRQEADGRFRAGSGALPWHGRYVDGEWPRINPPAWTVRDAIEKFGHVVPAFRDADIAEMWAGLIDMTPDALPVIDAPEDVEGLVIAMGFSGHGFCLGPVTGGIAAALAMGQEPNLPIAHFALARFAGHRTVSGKVTLHG